MENNNNLGSLSKNFDEVAQKDKTAKNKIVKINYCILHSYNTLESHSLETFGP